MNSGNLDYKTFHRRNLPHFHPKEGIIFITYRLHFALPDNIIMKIKQSKTDFINVFIANDEFLEMYNTGPKWLANPAIANVVYNNLLKMNEKQYHLFCFCIMPNHVHVLFKPLDDEKGNPISLAKIMHGHKGVTAREANILLNRRGKFWHSEYYDHYIRNYKEFYNLAWYVINNPVKANLVSKRKSWKFTWIEKQLEYDLDLDLFENE